MLIAGADEVGRGPLAGPVVAAAVILPPTWDLPGLGDSKAISEKRRESLFEAIKEQAVAWSLGRADVAEIDEFNILQASLLAMKRAINGLSPAAEQAEVDGNKTPELNIPVRAIVGGDAHIPHISAASILAKVARDREMIEWDAVHPEYGFAKHKGYPTKVHMQAIEQHGVLPLHRRSFGPVKKHLSRIEG